MKVDPISEVRVAGAILGRFFPPLELAADELYERVTAGERVNDANLPASLGFETGTLDSVMLEAFKACVPHVKSFLAAGGMALIVEWIRHRNTKRRDDEEAQRRTNELESLRQERQETRDSFARLMDLFVHRGIANDRQDAAAKIIQIIVQVPELTSPQEEKDDDD